MMRAVKTGSICIFVLSLCLSIFAYEYGIHRFGYFSRESFAILVVSITCGAVLLSLFMDWAITFPLQDFRKKIKTTWSEKKVLPSPEVLPTDLREFALGFVEVVEDVQKKMAVMGEMQKLDDAKYDFIAIANHQLRTPITEISWATDSLADITSVTGDKEAIEMVEKIKNGVTRVTEITGQFMAVAEMSLNREAHEQASVDVFVLVGDIVERLTPIAVTKKMVFDIKTEKKLIGTVRGDPSLLGFVFETLLTNAVIYGNEETSISIQVRNQNKSVVVSVENIGIELTSEEVPMLFEKFFRGKNAIHARPNGSGLALYLTKKILERYNGTIAVERKDASRIVFTAMLPFESKGELKQFIGNY